jgi:hypothetical protein
MKTASAPSEIAMICGMFSNASYRTPNLQLGLNAHSLLVAIACWITVDPFVPPQISTALAMESAAKEKVPDLPNRRFEPLRFSDVSGSSAVLLCPSRSS